MKMQTGIILVGYFVIATFNNFGTGVEVSSKVDLDSNENEESLDDATYSTIVNVKESANPPESILRAPKPSTFNWRHRSELVKTSELRKRRIYIYLPHDNSAKRPKIVNNIQVVVNSNDSMLNESSCEHDICNVSVSSKSDEKGNIITEVHLSIITKTNPNVKIDDVPVINGFRGVSEDHDKQPTFYPISSPRSIHTHLHRDNIPQIQTDYLGHVEPWYGRTVRQPQMYWRYRHFGDRGNVGFRNHNTWLRNKPIVDDKIEPPLSKTKPSDDTESK